MLFAPASLSARLAVLAVAAAAALPAGAQQVFRIVGPDGKVTFSDQPPADAAAKASPATAGQRSAGASTGNSALPFELRQVASRYPVTLYTGPNCAPCASGRTFLSGRGVPFAERTVSTAEDIEALNRLTGGSAALPLLSVGVQQLKGFSEPEWGQFLDAAGYPRSSQLPPGYRHAAATPLVVAQPVRPQAPAAAPEPAAAAPAPSPASALPSGSNPAGITF